MIDVRHIANLAKLSLEGEELEKIRKHFEKMLNYFKILDELDLENVEPLPYPHYSFQRMREDTEGEGIEREEALRDAPDTYLHYFRVPSPLKGIKKKF